jgi:hypothetical protein
MDEVRLTKNFREQTDATFVEAREAIEMATGDELATAREHGAEEIRPLLDLVRTEDLIGRLSTALQESACWWDVVRLAHVLGISGRALKRFLKVWGYPTEKPRRWKAEAPGHQDRIAVSESVIPEMDPPPVPGSRAEW